MVNSRDKRKHRDIPGLGQEGHSALRWNDGDIPRPGRPDAYYYMHRMVIQDGVLTKEKRGNYPEHFELIPGAIPDGAFIPACDRIDEMTDGFADDIEEYGAGEQLVARHSEGDRRLPQNILLHGGLHDQPRPCKAPTPRRHGGRGGENVEDRQGEGGCEYRHGQGGLEDRHGKGGFQDRQGEGGLKRMTRGNSRWYRAGVAEVFAAGV